MTRRVALLSVLYDDNDLDDPGGLLTRAVGSAPGIEVDLVHLLSDDEIDPDAQVTVRSCGRVDIGPPPIDFQEDSRRRHPSTVSCSCPSIFHPDLRCPIHGFNADQ